MRIRERIAFAAVACVLACSAVRAGDVPMEERRGLYDLSAVSSSNPVIARVDECKIVITAGEFKGYIDSLPRNDSWGVLSLENKKKLLEGLLEDHFLLWKGYEEKADQSAGIQSTLEETRKMLMTETLTEEEVVKKEKSPADYTRLLQELVDRLFDRTDILVLADGYAQLRVAAKTLEAGAKSGPAATQTASPDLSAVPLMVRMAPLAKSELGVVSVGSFLAMYVRIEPAERPDLAKPESVVAVLKELLRDDLLVAEAKRRGLDQAPIVREKMQMNRNVMTRMYVVDELTAQADAMTKRPEFEEQVKAWYQKHLTTKYTYFEPKTQSRVVMGYPEYREEIGNDCTDALIMRVRREAVAEMRKGKKVVVDEGAVAGMEVRGPLPTSLPDYNLDQ